MIDKALRGKLRASRSVTRWSYPITTPECPLRASAVSFALSGLYRLQTEALAGLSERQITSKLPEELSCGLLLRRS